MKRNIVLSILFLLAGCSSAPEGTFQNECSDGRDNDGDELIDCDDEDCVDAGFCGYQPSDDTAEEADADVDSDIDTDTDHDGED
jgi:hypothetical protein